MALAAGVLTGMLPLVHAHSFVVVMGTAFLLGLVFRQWRAGQWLAWVVYVLVALAIALPEIWWSTASSVASAGTFFGFEIGWDHRDVNPFWFWFLNTGLFIPLIIVALAVPAIRARLPEGLLLFSLPFLAWFVIPNLVKLAPWIWDNIKVLFYWYVGFVPIVALLIAWLLRDRLPLRAAGAGLLAALILAGSIDVWRVVSRQTIYQEFDANAIAIAEVIRRDTPGRATVLHAPTWNSAIFLTGRRSLLGYPGHVWSRGIDSNAREADIRLIYEGGPDAAALLERYEVDYILVTPLERSFATVNDQFIGRFREVGSAGDYHLYKVATG
jgi:hypothetical protein